MKTYVAFVPCLFFFSAAEPLGLSPPATPPINSSKIVDQGFVGFGIESTSFTQFTGIEGSMNKFSKHLIETFYNKTGAPVQVRVGGTSMDQSIYDPHQIQAMNITIAESRKLRAKVTFGSKWTEGFKQWPNVKWTLQIPFARKNATNGMIFAKGCVNAMDINTLQAIEIGNEPNFYAGPDRRRPYGPRQYAEEWKQYAGWVAGNITLPEGPMFQSMDIASGGNLSKWDVATMFDDYGLDEGAIIRSASYHYYQTTGGKPLRSTLLNHTDTEAKTNHFLPAIEYLNSTRDDSVHLIIGEAGSGLTNHRRDYNLEASLGTALWTVDWMLYCMSMNMTRVNMQLGVWFPFTAWTPIEYLGKPPHILGSFYGNLFIADFINKVGNLRVHQFKEAIPISEREKISAYAGYHHGELSKIVILNLEFWNQTVTEIIKSKDTDKPSSSSDKTTTTKTKTLPPPAQPDSSTSPSPPALSPI